jgi:3-isopropylmalate/(R)-2-methylmalate dehydratase large subunit
MGQTAVEKILSAHAGGRSLRPGELVWARVDVACIDDVQWPIFRDAFADLGGTIRDRERVVTIADHYLPPSTISEAETVAELRAFTEAQALPYGFFEHGIKHQVLIEEGLVKPGVLLVATDSHTPTAGAVGAIGIGVGPTEVAVAFAYGEVWLRVPHTIRIVLEGALPPMVFAKDIALHVLAREGTRFGNYRVLEFTGPLPRSMALSERMTLCNVATEMGAKAALVEFPAGVTSDADAVFEREIRVDAGTLEPLVAAPDLPSNGEPASKFRDVKVDQAFIGSCANATFDDLAVAARVLRGHRVKRGVQMIVSPSSRGAYQRALDEGLVDLFVKAGALFTSPGCGACAGGHMGTLGPGQVRISSQNRNFVGRAGHHDSRIYLASPAVVAASAITGYVTDPREVVGAAEGPS